MTRIRCKNILSVRLSQISELRASSQAACSCAKFERSKQNLYCTSQYRPLLGYLSPSCICIAFANSFSHLCCLARLLAGRLSIASLRCTLQSFSIFWHVFAAKLAMLTLLAAGSLPRKSCHGLMSLKQQNAQTPKDASSRRQAYFSMRSRKAHGSIASPYEIFETHLRGLSENELQ